MRRVERDTRGQPRRVHVSLHEGDVCLAHSLVDGGYAQSTAAAADVTATPAAVETTSAPPQPPAAPAPAEEMFDALASNIAYDAISKGYYIYQGQS